MVTGTVSKSAKKDRYLGSEPTTDPPTTSAGQPVPNSTTAGSTQTTGAEGFLSVGSWWARCSAGGRTSPTVHAVVACPVLGRSPHPPLATGRAARRAGARARARSRPWRRGGRRRLGGRGRGRSARRRSQPPVRPALPPTPPRRPLHARPDPAWSANFGPAGAAVPPPDPAPVGARREDGRPGRTGPPPFPTVPPTHQIRDRRGR